jgi:hypothetical protein
LIAVLAKTSNKLIRIRGFHIDYLGHGHYRPGPVRSCVNRNSDSIMLLFKAPGDGEVILRGPCQQTTFEASEKIYATTMSFSLIVSSRGEGTRGLRREGGNLPGLSCQLRAQAPKRAARSAGAASNSRSINPCARRKKSRAQRGALAGNERREPRNVTNEPTVGITDENRNGLRPFSLLWTRRSHPDLTRRFREMQQRISNMIGSQPSLIPYPLYPDSEPDAGTPKSHAPLRSRSAV